VVDRWEVANRHGVNVVSNALALNVVMDGDQTVGVAFRPKAPLFGFAPPFATGDLSQAPWSVGGDKGWFVDAGRLRSGLIGNGQQSVRRWSFTAVRAGVVSFDYLVSSEQKWDTLQFVLDGTVLGVWSGTGAGWQSYQTAVGAGAHVLEWRYVKDANFSAGQDGAWLDNVYGPVVPLVVEPPQLGLVSAEAGVVRLQVSGQKGSVCVVEATEALGPEAAWSEVGRVTLGAEPSVIEDRGAGEKPARYYRAVLLP